MKENGFEGRQKKNGRKNIGFGSSKNDKGISYTYYTRDYF